VSRLQLLKLIRKKSGKNKGVTINTTNFSDPKKIRLAKTRKEYMLFIMKRESFQPNFSIESHVFPNIMTKMYKICPDKSLETPCFNYREIVNIRFEIKFDKKSIVNVTI
jgi:ABC-type lipoprotein export system ATPase subunit